MLTGWNLKPSNNTLRLLTESLSALLSSTKYKKKFWLETWLSSLEFKKIGQKCQNERDNKSS